MAGTCSAILIVIVTLFLPPVGVFIISGCSADFLINILLTILGFLPGHIHAFYLEYIYFDRKKMGRHGRLVHKRAPGVFSDRIQNGGRTRRTS